MGVNNLPKVVTQLFFGWNWTHDLLIASPTPYCYASALLLLCKCCIVSRYWPRKTGMKCCMRECPRRLRGRRYSSSHWWRSEITSSLIYLSQSSSRDSRPPLRWVIMKCKVKGRKFSMSSKAGQKSDNTVMSSASESYDSMAPYWPKLVFNLF